MKTRAFGGCGGLEMVKFVVYKKIFQNMALSSDDALYCLLPSCKKFVTFNEPFQKTCPKPPIFDT